MDSGFGGTPAGQAGLEFAFNSIEWIRTWCGEGSTNCQGWGLSIPLNGFLSLPRRGVSPLFMSFNSIEWILRFLNVLCVASMWGVLSIPLNGFCTITVYVHCGNLFISIIWILFHWPPVGGLMYAVESGAYMFFGFLFMVFPCVYMGISIATVSLLVYG